MSEQPCGIVVGSKPRYLNRDQWEATACGCDLAAGHEGAHQCEHTRSRRVRGPVPSHDPSLPDEWQGVVAAAKAEREEQG